MILQGIEYLWASTEAKKFGNSDSLIFEQKSNELLYKSDFEDSTSLLFYEAAPMAIYTKYDSQKGMADTRMYFDKNFNLLPKYSIIHKVAKTNNTKLTIQKYQPFTTEEYENFEKTKILKYY